MRNIPPKQGNEDNRDHETRIDDDLAAQTVDDRLAYFKKHLGAEIEEYSKHEDRLRLLIDRDGDGRADVSTVFKDGFNGVLEGTGADVLARNGTIYYTCIPRLWTLRDDDDDGRADQQRVLHEGFGVRVAFRGHDLHGLCLGPDGRIYFSIGDRGFNVKAGAKEQPALANPETGAVFRCEQNGDGLEVHHSNCSIARSFSGIVWPRMSASDRMEVSMFRIGSKAGTVSTMVAYIDLRTPKRRRTKSSPKSKRCWHART